jgi:hypothetical protein
VGTAKSHDESLPVDKVSVEIRTGRQRQLKRTESTTSSSSIGTTAVYNDTGALAAAITSSKPSAKTSVKKPARAASNDRVTTRRTRQLPATAAGSKLSLNHVDLTLENMPPVKLSAASSEPIVPEKTVQEKENTLLQQEPPLKQTAGLQSQFKLMDDDDFAADDGDSSDFPPADAFWKRKPLAAGISASQPAMSSSSATAAGGTAVKTGSSDGRFVDLSFLKKP